MKPSNSLEVLVINQSFLVLQSQPVMSVAIEPVGLLSGHVRVLPEKACLAENDNSFEQLSFIVS